MNWRIVLLLGLLLTSAGAHVWQGRTARVLRGRIAELEAEAERRDARVQKLAEQGRARRSAPAPVAAPQPKARPFIPDEAPIVTDAEGHLDPRASAELRRDEVRQVLLNSVLDVVGDAAEEEGWDPEVAADVMAVFEATATRMGEVRAEVLDGKMKPVEGRELVLDLRDKAGTKLETILGEDDTARLRDRMFDRVTASVDERRSARNPD